MAIYLQQPITGSDATYEASGTAIAIHTWNLNSTTGDTSITGSVVEKEVYPDNSARLNPVFTINYSGNDISRLDMFVPGSEYRKNFTVNASGLVTNIGSWYKP